MESNTNENAANRSEPLPQRWAIILIGGFVASAAVFLLSGALAALGAAAATVVGLHQLIPYASVGGGGLPRVAPPATAPPWVPARVPPSALQEVGATALPSLALGQEAGGFIALNASVICATCSGVRLEVSTLRTAARVTAGISGSACPASQAVVMDSS